ACSTSRQPTGRMADMNATKVLSVIIMALSTSLTIGCAGTESDDLEESEAAMVAADAPATIAQPASASGRDALPVRPSTPSRWMPGPDDDSEPSPPRVGPPHGPGAMLDDDDDDCGPPLPH